MSIKKWSEFEFFPEYWRERISLMASYIHKDKVVIDIGCGPQWLKDYLLTGCEYIPVDYISRSADTMVCDLNSYEFPNAYGDVIFLSGVVEYVIDTDWFFEQVVNHAHETIILSYCLSDGIDNVRRKNNNWVNALQHNHILDIFSNLGMHLDESFQILENQVYIFSRKKVRNPYGVLIYPTRVQNLGDFTQTLAVINAVGRRDDAVYLNRENLAQYRGKPLKVICNGWFSHAPLFPPSNLLSPLYVSMHIAEHAQIWFSTKEFVNHLNKFSPIGCRDKSTYDFLSGLKIPAYYSGCITLALGLEMQSKNQVSKEAEGKIYLVDPPITKPKNYLEKIVIILTALSCPKLIYKVFLLTPKPHHFFVRLKYSLIFSALYGKLIKILGDKNVVIKTQLLEINKKSSSCKVLFKMIEEDISNFSSAEAVITSRIHVALPSAAAGANLVFLYEDNLTSQEENRITDQRILFGKVKVINNYSSIQDILDMVNKNFHSNNEKIKYLAHHNKKIINEFLI